MVGFGFRCKMWWACDVSVLQLKLTRLSDIDVKDLVHVGAHWDTVWHVVLWHFIPTWQAQQLNGDELVYSLLIQAVRARSLARQVIQSLLQILSLVLYQLFQIFEPVNALQVAAVVAFEFLTICNINEGSYVLGKLDEFDSPCLGLDQLLIKGLYFLKVVLLVVEVNWGYTDWH